MTTFKCDVLVITPFRKPTFRNSISCQYPLEEPWDSQPLIIAACCERVGLTVRYLPLQNIFNGFQAVADGSTLIQILKSNLGRVVVFAADNFIPSRSTATTFGLRYIAREIKLINDKTTIAVSGRLATTFGNELLRIIPDLDIVLAGEVEMIIGSLCDRWIKDRGNFEIDQCVGTRNDRKNAATPNFVKDLTELPPPAFHLVPAAALLHNAIRRKETRIPVSIRTSQGCSFHCRFCGGVPNWNLIRVKNRIQVQTELKEFCRHVRPIGELAFFEDEVFTLYFDHVDMVASLLEQNDLIVGGIYTHSSLMNARVASRIARTCRQVYMGLDSVDDEALVDMGKKQSLASVLRAVEIARDAGILVHLETIIGHPRETLQTAISCLAIAFDLLSTGMIDSLNTYIFCPHPGTSYAQEHSAGKDYKDWLDNMQESGGFPTSATDGLSQQQVFVVYLVSQLMIAEIALAKTKGWKLTEAKPSAREHLLELFRRFA